MDPRRLQFKTWYLDKVRLRIRDHHLVVVNIEGKELKVMKARKRMDRAGSEV